MLKLPNETPMVRGFAANKNNKEYGKHGSYNS